MHRHWEGKSRRSRIAARIGIGIVIVTIVCLVFGWAVMWLWNTVLPDLLGVRAITYGQAIGLLVLCRLLFGGMHPFRKPHPPCAEDPRCAEALEKFVERGR